MRHCPRPLILFMLLLAALLVGCKKKTTVAPESTSEREMARIAVLHDDDTEEDLIDILVAAGYLVTDLGEYDEYEGTDFSEWDLLFVLTGTEYCDELQDGVEEGWLQFMLDGGTLVTTEWMGYCTDGDYLNELISAMPLAYDGGYCDDGDGDCIDTFTVEGNHPLTEGLPTFFDTPHDYTYSYMVRNNDSTSANADVLMTGEDAGAVLGIGEYGKGSFIHWNNGGVYGGDDIWDENTVRILLNIAEFAQ